MHKEKSNSEVYVFLLRIHNTTNAFDLIIYLAGLVVCMTVRRRIGENEDGRERGEERK